MPANMRNSMMDMQMMDALDFNPIEEAANQIQSLTESLERETANTKVDSLAY